MTPTDIIRMAREAGFGPAVEWPECYPPFERFAVIVADAEREACEKYADDQWVKNPNVSGGDAIRARSLQTGAKS